MRENTYFSQRTGQLSPRGLHNIFFKVKMWLLHTLHSLYTSTSPTSSSANNSVTFPLGPSVRRGHLTDIKKNQFISLGPAAKWNGATGFQWACGSFYQPGSMPGCHNARCVSSPLGRMEGGINEEKEQKERVIQGWHRERVQLITGWPLHTSQRGNWSLGCGWGSRLRMSQKKYKLWRTSCDLNTADTQIQWEPKHWKLLSRDWWSSTIRRDCVLLLL